MNLAQGSAAKRYFASYLSAWDHFWFTPRLPHTLSILRIITGLMLLYSHLVLATDLTSFLGDHAWISNETARQLHDGAFGPDYMDMGRSYLWYISSPVVLWLHHLLTILITAAFAVGFMTRITAPLTFALQLMYLHRLTGTLFGLDQIVTYSVMYLMISPCGSCYSVDAWLRKKLAGRLADHGKLRWLLPDAVPAVSANIATRLFQLHLCVIYLFGGLSKARGESWWDGTAVWYSVGNYEYQSMDMTWLASYPRVASAMSHLTMFWEVFYCALIWPKITRPFVLGLAMAVHGGIALFLGMITFGVMMIAANLIFIEPHWIAALARRKSGIAVDAAAEPLDVAATKKAAPPAEQQVAAAAPESDGSIAAREQEVRLAMGRVKAKSKKLKQRESRYRDRVKRLKEREEKIKRLVERRRQAKAARERKPEEE